MATILKVKAARRQTGTLVEYTYPPEYNPEQIQVLCYESNTETTEIQARGNLDEYLIGVVSDEHSVSFLESEDIIEVTREEAISEGTRWRPQITKMFDQSAVIEVLAKHALGMQLTASDEATINSNDRKRGLNKSKGFTVLMDEYIDVM